MGGMGILLSRFVAKKKKRCKFNVSPTFYLMPQTGIEPFYLISNTDRKGLWRLHHGCGVQKVFKRLSHTN